MVDLPGTGADAGGGAAADFFEIDDRADGGDVVSAGGVGGFLRADRNGFSPRGGAVVVVGGDAQLQRVEVTLVDSVVEPQQVGAEFLDELDVAVPPVDQEFFACGVAAIRVVVEVRPLRVEEVGRFCAEVVGKVLRRIDELEILEKNQKNYFYSKLSL